MGEDQTALRDYQRRVEAFGGRIGSPAMPSLQELSKTVLGSLKTLPTAGAVPISAAPITLAEMVVSHPIAVDVSFSYPNIVGTPGIFNALNVGDGYVQITWGVKGATKHVVKVDGNMGWRFPFVASQLLVQYFPVDTESTGNKAINIGQTANLQIAANIAPASGAPCLPLTRTLYFPNVLAGTAAQQKTPAFAYEARLVASTNLAADYTIEFFGTVAGQLLGFDSDGLAGGHPRWILPVTWWQVPQGGIITNIGLNLAGGFELDNPSVIFKLAL